MPIKNWAGVFPALLTPFTADDKLDLAVFTKNLQAQIDAGVEGVIIGGSLGEASTISNEEKKELFAAAKKTTPAGFPVLVNVAEQTTKGAIALVQDAEEYGADGLMLLPPMRYPSDDRETTEFFKTVGQNTSLPILLYNNPFDYKTNITIAMFEELAKLPNMQAVKESSRDVTNVTRMRNAFGDRYKILCGVDTLALEELCLGADGWVAGLVDAFPAETVAIFKLAKAGRIKEATEIYRWFMPLLELDIHPKLVQYIKMAAAAAGIGTEYVRAPRLTVVGAERNKVEAVIKTGLANRPTLPEYKNL